MDSDTFIGRMAQKSSQAGRKSQDAAWPRLAMIDYTIITDVEYFVNQCAKTR